MNPFSDRLRQAIDVGMVHVDELKREAIIFGPPDAPGLTNEDWMAILQAASEVNRELTALGYAVKG